MSSLRRMKAESVGATVGSCYVGLFWLIDHLARRRATFITVIGNVENTLSAHLARCSRCSRTVYGSFQRGRTDLSAPFPSEAIWCYNLARVSRRITSIPSTTAQPNEQAAQSRDRSYRQRKRQVGRYDGCGASHTRTSR